MKRALRKTFCALLIVGTEPSTDDATLKTGAIQSAIGCPA
jgi:hypothetical protein